MDFSAGERMTKVMMGFLILLYFIFTCGECENTDTNPCTPEETCAKCIQKDPRCGWCSQEDFTKRKIPRCDFVEDLRERNCSDLIYPISSMKDIVDLELSEPGASRGVIQIYPQVKRLELRPKSPETFSVKYRQVVDYPIDLYYLVDVSNSMEEHKDSVKKLGAHFANKVGSVSSDFTLGVGSFLDENTDNMAGIKNPVFQNLMKLNPNRVDFQKAVVSCFNKLDASDNITSPVGTLNAITQAVMCGEVEWRNDSKKLLVIVTGNHFHYGGDGKLRGSIEPNDGACHTNSDGYYMKQDYPSLSQLNRKIKKHNITLIFAVTDDLLDVYGNLSNRLIGSATGNLSDIDGIMNLIKQQYEAMSTLVEMTDTAQGSENIQVSYASSCLDGENMERNVCKGAKPADTVSFDITIKFLSCPENHKEIVHNTVTIRPVGRSSNLTLELEMICGCSCEKEGNEGQVEQNCTGRGAYKCGICYCSNYTYGTECECDGVENQTQPEESECKRGKEERLCSHRGECRCGRCFCNQTEENPAVKYYGKYCECSDYSCIQAHNKICNGHGACVCGECKCNEGWSDRDCTCSNTTEHCFADDNEVMCSGHGSCYCGSCKCDETYYGQFCEDCPSCPGKCEEYGVCVKCILSNKDEEMPYKNCQEICETRNVRVVELVDKVEVNEILEEKACSIQDEDGCHIFFKYEKGNNKTTIIHAQKRIDCPEPPDVVAIVAGTIGSILLAGLILLLMWKLLTYAHDRREFAKFERERERAKWDRGQNPIFIQPTTTFENPAYQRS